MSFAKEDEDLYLHFTRYPAGRTENGVRQFILYCSHNIKPRKPDPYFLCLKDGRTWFFWLQEQLRQLYYNKWEWWGWAALEDDWKATPWILKRLTSWRKNDH